jgi:hypothetical protein
MFRHDPSVMLHAPLRTMLYADPDGDTQFAIDQPGLLFASYRDPGIADVGRELDTLLAGLITLLGGDPPAQLQSGEPGLRRAPGEFARSQNRVSKPSQNGANHGRELSRCG